MSKAVYARQLAKSEQAELSRLVRSNQDARVVRRAQMIWWTGQGGLLPIVSTKNCCKSVAVVIF